MEECIVVEERVWCVLAGEEPGLWYLAFVVVPKLDEKVVGVKCRGEGLGGRGMMDILENNTDGGTGCVAVWISMTTLNLDRV
jgi:hypothetical protein